VPNRQIAYSGEYNNPLALFAKFLYPAMGTATRMGKEFIMTDTLFPHALTFDDILLEPGYSKILPKDAVTKTQLTKNIQINIPILSAAMDTVTEARTAIAMARHGGLGFIHKNLTIEEQATEVLQVKRSETGVVVDPVTLDPDATVGEARAIMARLNISGFPVTKSGKLVGIMTNRDLRFVEGDDIKVSEIMTKEELITVNENFSIEEAKGLLQKHRIEKLLVVDNNQNLKGLMTVRDIERKKEFPLAVKDGRDRLLVGAAVGVGKDGLNRMEALHDAGVDVVVVDTAHGHSEMVLEMVRVAKKKFPSLQVIAGNVATAGATSDLIKAGADAIKVGIGPGSICTTRIVTGVGVPQVYALQQCVSVAKKAGVPIIADGGIKFSGDFVKAIGLGASTIMIGSLFAGTDESPGEIILYQGRSYKLYRGMGSLGAMRQGSKDRYFQADVEEAKKLVPEGIEGRVPYRGPLADSLYQMVGGLRSAMGYLGAKDIAEMQEKAKFVKISASGLKESHVHDVMVTKEAPNYRVN
jgi:IMP dehydrogenase